MRFIISRNLSRPRGGVASSDFSSVREVGQLAQSPLNFKKAVWGRGRHLINASQLLGGLCVSDLRLFSGFFLRLSLFFVLSATINGRSDNHTKPKNIKKRQKWVKHRFASHRAFLSFLLKIFSCVDLKLKKKRN